MATIGVLDRCHAAPMVNTSIDWALHVAQAGGRPICRGGARTPQHHRRPDPGDSFSAGRTPGRASVAAHSM